MSLYELINEPELDSPVLLLSLQGWIDAGLSANHAADTLLEGLDTTTVARFDQDELLDFRARRPTLHLVEGANTGISWATIELIAAKDTKGQDILVLTGAEPDRIWRRFTEAVHELVSRFDVRMVVGMGAYPAGTPHTRPPLMSMTAGSRELADSLPYQRATLESPAGIQAVIERRFADDGVPALGLWAQVPHYVSTMRFPAASLALIEAVNSTAGLELSVGRLPHQAERSRRRIDALIKDNSEHVEMLEQLEHQYDRNIASGPTSTTDGPGFGDLPSGDELAAEVERFLREQGRE